MEEESSSQEDMADPIYYLANTHQYTMYFHQAMQKQGKEYFVRAIFK